MQINTTPHSLTFVGLVTYASDPFQSNHHHVHIIEMATPVSPNHYMKVQAVNVPAASASTAKNTVWQLDKTRASSKPKPKRPYTPYNLFYLLERELVVQRINGPPKNIGIKRKHVGIAPREEDHIKPSSRYDGIVMAPYWYDPNMKEKRKHRKTQGMVSSLLCYYCTCISHIYCSLIIPLFLQITDFLQGANWNHLRKLGSSE